MINPETLIRDVISQQGTLDRQVIATLSEAYSEVELLRDQAFRALQLCAQKYAETYLRAYFEVVPWREELITNEETFEVLYRFILERTDSFKSVTPTTLASILHDKPCGLLILRLILGYSLDELELILQGRYGVVFSKDQLREIELLCEETGLNLLTRWREEVVPQLSEFLYSTAHGETFAELEGIDLTLFKPRLQVLHIDPSKGWFSVSEMATHGVTFAALLYQRYIGGTVRQALDIGSSLKADLLEGPVDSLFVKNRIPFYRSRPRERFPDWEQAPDFLIPDKTNPEVIIEAKVAEDGGTARDKASRIERLSNFSRSKGVECIAIIDGKGFRRINDVLVPILRNCRGQVFSYSNLTEILSLPGIAKWISKS